MPIPGLGYYNNYGAYANALSDDFMASQYFRQLADTAQNGISGYYSTGSYSNQPQTDTFEKQVKRDIEATKVSRTVHWQGLTCFELKQEENRKKI